MAKIIHLILFSFILLSALQAHALEIRITDDLNNPMKDVAVALFPQSAQDKVRDDNLEIMQRNFKFKPRMATVQKGTKVAFPNRDKSHHHIYSFSEAKSFEIPLYIGQSPVLMMDKEGIVPLGCNIHDWMLGYIVVVDTPYHNVSNNEGTLEIKDVPAGSYIVKFWHPGLNETDGVHAQKSSLSVSNNKDSYNILIPRGDKFSWPKKPAYLEGNY